MSTTANLGLTNIDGNDYANIGTIDSNFQIIDTAVGNLSVKITFDSDDWTDKALTIAQTAHKKTSDAFSYRIYHLVDGVLKSTTWAVMGTQVAYDADTGNIILTTEDPFDGQIILIG